MLQICIALFRWLGIVNSRVCCLCRRISGTNLLQIGNWIGTGGKALGEDVLDRGDVIV